MAQGFDTWMTQAEALYSGRGGAAGVFGFSATLRRARDWHWRVVGRVVPRDRTSLFVQFLSSTQT